MRAITTIFFIFISLTLFGQVNDADAFFNGSYDKKFVQQHRIKQADVEIYIDSNKSSKHIIDFNQNGLLTTESVLNKNDKISKCILFQE